MATAIEKARTFAQSVSDDTLLDAISDFEDKDRHAGEDAILAILAAEASKRFNLSVKEAFAHPLGAAIAFTFAA